MRTYIVVVNGAAAYGPASKAAATNAGKRLAGTGLSQYQVFELKPIPGKS